MKKINEYRKIKTIITAITLGFTMNGCYYEIDGEKQDIITKTPSTYENAKIYDSIIYTNEFKDYLNIRGIKPEECKILETTDEYLIVEVEVKYNKIKENESILYLCKKYDMSISKFKEINSNLETFDEKENLPIGIDVNIEYQKVLKLSKEQIKYKWIEFVVKTGDNVYGYGDADWNVINIIKDNNNLDDKYTIYPNDIIYVPDVNSVYNNNENTKSKKYT